MSDAPVDELRSRVRTILDREIGRLEQKSNKDGLGLTDVKVLDLLIKAASNFAPPPDSDKPTPADPATASDDELLNGLNGTEQTPV